MKKFFLSLAIMMIATLATFAQVPTVMMYQVQIKHGKAAAQDVSIEMQIRTSEDGSAIWSQTFNLKDVKNGSVQNLGLDFGDKVNLGNGEYWLATIVDGEEKGCAKLTSVPYAFVAKTAMVADYSFVAKTATEAKTLEGMLTAEELIGAWECKHLELDGGETKTSNHLFTFYNDSTFTWSYSEFWSYDPKRITKRTGSGKWLVMGSGNFYYSLNYVEEREHDSDSMYIENIIPTYIDRNVGKLVFGGGDFFFRGGALVLTKAQNETTR